MGKVADIVKPMLAIPSTGASGRDPIDLATLVETGDWVLDLKLDGVRTIHQDGQLWNRRGTNITHKFPEVITYLRTHMKGVSSDIVIDGEIVADDGRFESTLYRESLERSALIARAVVDHPVRFVAFDVPAAPGRWSWRRDILEDLGIEHTPTGDSIEFFDHVGNLGMEGVIAKRRISRYEPGQRSPHWVKFKHLHRISCLLAGYTPGNGSRAHFGALTLALVDEKGQVVPVGRCGSGFTERETHVLKARLDAGELLIAEIETVNYTSGGTLRFPVFRGLRTDIAPSDCTTAQLAALPRC